MTLPVQISKRTRHPPYLRTVRKGELIPPIFCFDPSIDPWIVAALNVIEYVGARVACCLIPAAMNTLSLEHPEEPLGRCIIRTMADSAHSAHELRGFEKRLVLAAGELCAAIGMWNNRLVGRTAVLPGLSSASAPNLTGKALVVKRKDGFIQGASIGISRRPNAATREIVAGAGRGCLILPRRVPDNLA